MKIVLFHLLFFVVPVLWIARQFYRLYKCGEFDDILARWRGESRLARAVVIALLLAVTVYGSDKILGGAMDRGLMMATRFVVGAITNTFSESEIATGYAVASTETNEVHVFTMPEHAIEADRIARRGANRDGFWRYHNYTNQLFRAGLANESPMYVQSDGTVTVNSPAYEVPFTNMTSIAQASNVTVYAPMQGNYGFLPSNRWDDVTISRIWTMETEYNSKVVSWEGALLNRDTSTPVSFQAEFFDGGDIVFRYSEFPTNSVIGGIFRNGSALTLDNMPTNLTSVLLKYIGDLGTGIEDADGDGLTNWEEIMLYGTDPHLADTDGDGVSDWEEITQESNPLNPDEDRDGVPDGVPLQDWTTNPLLGANAGYTNLVITVLEGMSTNVAPPRLLAISGTGSNGASTQTALLDVDGYKMPLYKGSIFNLALPSGKLLPYQMHISGRLPVQLSVQYTGDIVDSGLWLEGDDIFAPKTWYNGMSGRMAIPELELEMVNTNESYCVHEHPGYRDFVPVLKPFGPIQHADCSLTTGFDLNADGSLRLYVDDYPPSYATGAVFLVGPSPLLTYGSLSAEVSIHRCEYDDHAGCYLCGGGHDVAGLNIEIEHDVYYTFSGVTNGVCLRLASSSASPANWSIFPQIDGGARLHSACDTDGAYSIDGVSEVWVSAGMSNISYIVTAVHSEAHDVQDSSTLYTIGTPVVVFDYNRDGVIDNDDTAIARTGEKPFRFWINDDNDNGDLANDDTPGSGPNYGNNSIDGRCDLIDFTPAWLDFTNVFPENLSSSVRDSINWSLKSSCVNIVLTDYSRDTASAFQITPKAGCGPLMSQNAHEATVTDISNGYTLPSGFIAMRNTHPDRGVFLIEGKSTGTNLVVKGTIGGNATSEGTRDVNISISSVEDMYRRINFRGYPRTDGSLPEVPEEPINMPDSETSDRHLVFVHGFNVDENGSRGWSAEIFKRLWQSGMTARFSGVSWEGDIGASWNYHENVSNAFETAAYLSTVITNLPGEKVLMAHSLGNMVCSEMIQNYNLEVSKFLMCNSAVTAEAYDQDPSLRVFQLVHPDWEEYPTNSWASSWHVLFKDVPNDDRRLLGWPGYFSKVVQYAVNFYSSGDEVLELVADNNLSILTGATSGYTQFSWHHQELWKGRGYFNGLGATTWSGWDIRENLLGINTISISQARNMTDADFRTNTVFNLHPQSMNMPTIPPLVRGAHLAQGIPALAPAAGRCEFGGDVLAEEMINLNDTSFSTGVPRPNGWPYRSRWSTRWLHSDIKNVAYYFNFNFYKTIIGTGGL